MTTTRRWSSSWRCWRRSFNKQPAEAYRIMMMVHTQGKGLCGVYPHEVAETKVATVIDRARDNGFPLLAAMEPE